MPHARSGRPPRTNGHESLAEQQRVAIRRHAGCPRLCEPDRRLFAGRIGAGQIVVARTHDHVARVFQQREISQDDDRLRVERHRRADVEVIAGHDDEVERRRRTNDPVELWQRVVQVRDEEDSHVAIEYSDPTLRRTLTLRRPPTLPHRRADRSCRRQGMQPYGFEGMLASNNRRGDSNVRKLIFGAAVTVFAAAALAEEAWYPSKYGSNDTIGAANNLSPAGVVDAAKLVKTGKVYSLGVTTGPDTPAYGTRTFQIFTEASIIGTPLGTNKATGNDDFLATWMGIGSQLDGLGHLGIDYVYYNGHRESEFLRPHGLLMLSTDKIPPLVTRGVLLDFVALKGGNLAPGTAMNRADIEAAVAKQKTPIRKGDVVLLHTGWLAALAATDKKAYLEKEPGLGKEGANLPCVARRRCGGRGQLGRRDDSVRRRRRGIPGAPDPARAQRGVHPREHERRSARCRQGLRVPVRVGPTEVRRRRSGDHQPDRDPLAPLQAR